MEDNRPRYSDEELEEFRILIEKKIADARKEYDELVSSYDDNNSEESRGLSSFEKMEESVTASMRAEVKQLADRQLFLISKLQAALVRIENKTYGICRDTGKLIPKARLMAVPHATLTVEAKEARGK
ncbi:MAG: TraR/DksA family transcriptional regulator [Bacteroidales bacterium]|nr:TraR/DksA family transcriptional regulator [Bacteroidales bacterium]MBD5217210.1 TraR/DksA family transcriptional regulator [Bacteroidales bacterium]